MDNNEKHDLAELLINLHNRALDEEKYTGKDYRAGFSGALDAIMFSLGLDAKIAEILAGRRESNGRLVGHGEKAIAKTGHSTE